MAQYTKKEIEEKTADVVIDIIAILQDDYPETFKQIIQQIQEPDHQVWMRKWIHCKTCNNSWFEEGGEPSTCTCIELEE